MPQQRGVPGAEALRCPSQSIRRTAAIVRCLDQKLYDAPAARGAWARGSAMPQPNQQHSTAAILVTRAAVDQRRRPRRPHQLPMAPRATSIKLPGSGTSVFNFGAVISKLRFDA